MHKKSQEKRKKEKNRKIDNSMAKLFSINVKMTDEKSLRKIKRIRVTERDRKRERTHTIEGERGWEDRACMGGGGGEVTEERGRERYRGREVERERAHITYNKHCTI